MDKKIGIVTLYGLYNYGNRLQNYAIHKLMQDLGFDSVTLVCLKSRAWHVAQNIFRIWNTLIRKPEYQRRTAFLKFVKRTTPVRYIYSREMRIPDSVSEEFIGFFTGSDQVWNPEIRVNEKYNYFLRFAPANKRFSISPSFGVSAIPEKFVKEYSEWLSEFRFLSCREAEGAEIVKKLTGKDAQVLIDPTMMLNRDEWKKIYEDISVPNQPYMLLYFLGDISDDRRGIINKIANENKLLVIDVLNKNETKYMNMQPDGLLQMIDNAALVCTDSFHVAAFSINFNIPFYVFSRHQKETFGNRMLSRIENLLSLFGLSERLNPKTIEHALQCDFSYANDIIEIERQKERNYLLKCLEACQTK
ncbi:MAG: polysaccharide pyruvyl transferase family protein [Eubacteriales bacterium]|nr:polysaccharide pyruvyl transferase family protein [Eubacteriales bacterium]